MRIPLSYDPYEILFGFGLLFAFLCMLAFMRKTPALTIFLAMLVMWIVGVEQLLLATWGLYFIDKTITVSKSILEILGIIFMALGFFSLYLYDRFTSRKFYSPEGALVAIVISLIYIVAFRFI